MAPISAGGMAIIMQPKPATKDSFWAPSEVREDSTRWKYTCQGIPPKTSRSMQSIHNIVSRKPPIWPIHRVGSLDRSVVLSWSKAAGMQMHCCGITVSNFCVVV
jgi:hypothetical protein